jgi:hypothetical protein
MDKDRIANLQAKLTDVSVNTLGDTYALLRQQEKDLVASIADQQDKIKYSMAAIEWEIRGRLNTQELQSFKLKSGSNFHIRTQTNYSVANLDKLYEHLEERRANGDGVSVYGAFPKRINKDYVKAWMDAHDGELPPGLDVITERKIIFQQRG